MRRGRPKIINPTIDVHTGSISDDGFAADYGGYYNNYAINFVGRFYSSHYGVYYHQHSWYRWTGFTIPSGSTINSNSYVTLRAYSGSLGWAGPISTRIYFDDQSSPSTPSTASDYLSRSLTTNYAAWTISDAQWTSGNWYNSPSIQNGVQELVDLYGHNYYHASFTQGLYEQWYSG